MRDTASKSWTLAGLPPSERIERWRHVLSITRVPFRLSTQLKPSQPFVANVRQQMIDDIAVIDVECDPHGGWRRSAQLMDTEGEYVVLLMNLAGSETIEQLGRQARLGPGQALVWDSSRECRYQVHERVRKRSLFMPRRAVEEVSGQPWKGGVLRIPIDSPELRVLSGYLEVLVRTAQDLGADAVHSARNAALELFVGAAGPTKAHVAATDTKALRAAMDRFIEDHVASDAVTPADLAHTHGVSERTVYRLFSETGDTVRGVVRRKRLERAREDLIEGHQSISWIAHRWGFSDSAHFSRVFRASHGMSPRAYREATLTATAGSGSA